MTNNGPPDGPSEHSALVSTIGEQLRKIGAQSVLVNAVIAKAAHLTATDLECLDLIYLEGTVTAGRLAKATGLTTGAVTAMIDRLTRKGLVARAHDTHDRRRVLVSINRDRAEAVARLYDPLSEAMQTLWPRFSVEELEIVGRFLSIANETTVRGTVELRRQIEES
jgi:DNA-binding MarR family transcriptional regulator